MSRLRPFWTAIALGGLGGSLLTGNVALCAAFVFLTLGVVPLWIRRTSRHPAGDRSWSARGVPVGEPQRGLGERPPAGRVAIALGRVEARELLVNPWFGVGVGFCVVMVMGFAPDYDGLTGGETRGRLIQDLQFLAHPLVGMAVLAGHHAATRAHRDRTIELFECCPTTPKTRSLGALIAAWVPTAALAVFFGAYLVSADLFSPVPATLGPAAVPNLLAGLVLGTGGAALGLALGRWVRIPLAPVVAVVLIGFVSLRLGNGDDDGYAPRMVLSTMGPIGDPTPIYTAGQAWAHAAWMLALTAATVVVALAPAPRRGHLTGSTS